MATRPCWPCLSWHPTSSNPTFWLCNQSIHFTYDPILQHHITAQAFIGNVPCVCLCKCTNMYNIHHIIITISAHQAYIIISTQHFNIYILHHNVTKQWPLAAAELHVCCSDDQIRYSDKPQYWRIINPSLLVVARSNLTVASLSVSTCQSTNPNLSLPVAVRTNLTTASTHGFDQPSHTTISAYQQNQPITTQSFALL